MEERVNVAVNPKLREEVVRVLLSLCDNLESYRSHNEVVKIADFVVHIVTSMCRHDADKNIENLVDQIAKLTVDHNKVTEELRQAKLPTTPLGEAWETLRTLYPTSEGISGFLRAFDHSKPILSTEDPTSVDPKPTGLYERFTELFHTKEAEVWECLATAAVFRLDRSEKDRKKIQQELHNFRPRFGVRQAFVESWNKLATEKGYEQFGELIKIEPCDPAKKLLDDIYPPRRDLLFRKMGLHTDYTVHRQHLRA